MMIIAIILIVLVVMLFGTGALLGVAKWIGLMVALAAIAFMLLAGGA